MMAPTRLKSDPCAFGPPEMFAAAQRHQGDSGSGPKTWDGLAEESLGRKHGPRDNT